MMVYIFLRVYLASSGKQRLAIKAPTSDDGSLIKVSQIIAMRVQICTKK